jgi:hypothetical protein
MWLGSWLLLACGKEARSPAPTVVLVRVDGEVDEVAKVRVTVQDRAQLATGSSATLGVGDAGDGFPLFFKVVPPKGETQGSFVVRVDGLDDADALRVSAQAWARFAPGKTRLLQLLLSSDCDQVLCADDQSCHYGDEARTPGECGDILSPNLTEPASVPADESTLPTLIPPARERSSRDADGRDDAEVDAPDPSADAAVAAPAEAGRDAPSGDTGTAAASRVDANAAGANDAASQTSAEAGGAGSCLTHTLDANGTAPDVLVVFDRSQSMLFGNRWEPSRQATETVLRELEHAIAFGLVLFPANVSVPDVAGVGGLGGLLGGGGTGGGGASQCVGGEKLDVPTRLDNAAAISAVLDATMPEGFTPTASALLAAGTALGDRTPQPGAVVKPGYVLLVTDGAPACQSLIAPEGDVMEVDAARMAVSALKAKNIPTYVVGYQIDAASLATMNELARLGGTTSYYPVESGTQLSTALRAITSAVVEPCRYAVPGVDPAPLVRVEVDGRALPPNDADGWTLNGKTLTLHGAACSTLNDGKSHTLRVQTCP